MDDVVTARLTGGFGSPLTPRLGRVARSSLLGRAVERSPFHVSRGEGLGGLVAVRL